ncbi:MAG: ribonuclease P protein component [Acidobacteria bacterium]|nr:ribonuclease P protein component [Acidobacteriota bacterium]
MLRQTALRASGKKLAFPRCVRLLRTADYRKVYAAGRRRNLDFLLAFVLPTEKPLSRIGLAVPRSLGGAVERNRLKRRLREAARRHLGELGPGWDVVFNPRPAAKTVAFARLEGAVQKLFLSCAQKAAEEKLRSEAADES